MTCVTYTKDVHFGSEVHGVADVARFSVSIDDLRRWEHLLSFANEQDLAYIEAWDYRCKFYATTDQDEVEGSGDDLVECTFRQESSRLVIMACQKSVKFTGYEKHAGAESEWNTEPLALADIAKDLGVTLSEPCLPKEDKPKLEPSAVADWLVDCLMLYPFGPSDTDTAKQLLIEACDELVYDLLGTGKQISEGINNQGLEVQLEAVLYSISDSNDPVEKLVSMLRLNLDVLKVEKMDFQVWSQKAISKLNEILVQDEVVRLGRFIVDKTEDELVNYAARKLNLANCSYSVMRSMAVDRGLI